LLLDLLPGFQTADLVFEVCRFYFEDEKSAKSDSRDDRELSAISQLGGCDLVMAYPT
jgi:hypothetical protein